MKCFSFTNALVANKKDVSNCIYYRSKHFFLNTFLLLAFFAGPVATGFAQPDGEKLFKANCATCHTLTDKKLTGPGLGGIMTRVPSEQWLFDWIKNNAKLTKSGETYAVKISQFDPSQMTIFEGVLSDEDITAVVAYVKNPPVKKKEDGPIVKEVQKEQGLPTHIVLLCIAITLLVVVVVLGTVKRHLQDSVNAKKGLPPADPMTGMDWASRNKRTVALIGIVCVIVLAKWTYEGLMTFSVDQDYLPAQPIKYSHETHAGKLQINCVYCHSGAEKGRTAGVPSANVCMNCHKAVSEGPKTGTAEIAKIYDAVGWNPETGKYDKPQKPIQWVRVHSLPDFAYFNHSQHVVVGKQDCANCHGDMTKVDEAKQNSPLTMGWCIDCHRKTEVPGMASNPYYEELHAKLKEQYKGKPITVEKMGGLDCIKCHY